MENPEKLATRRGNREWKIQRNWQYWVHKPQDKDKQKQETIVVNITQCQHVFLFFFFFWVSCFLDQEDAAIYQPYLQKMFL